MTPRDDSESVPNTLNPIEIDYGQLRDKPLHDYIDALCAQLKTQKDAHFEYYNGLRRGNASWANDARRILAILAAIATLLTAAAGAVRLLAGTAPPDPPVDIWLFVAALAVYAIMAAVAQYERHTDRTEAYFRHLANVMAIRDLWNRLTFAVLPFAVRPVDPGTDVDCIAEVDRLAEAFVTDVNALATDEMSAWKGQHLESLAELADAAVKGQTDVTATLKAAIADLEASAERARAAAEKAESARSPAVLNFTITGDLEGEVTLTIDGRDVARTHLRKFPVDRLVPGLAKIEAAGMAPDGSPRAAALMHSLEPGVQDVEIELV